MGSLCGASVMWSVDVPVQIWCGASTMFSVEVPGTQLVNDVFNFKL